ncbi:hypothetical protein GCM10010435_33650 [Winogradskya consettensis]|uniref:CBM2 domain-containing protein n=1 Tax=Winogradskya consettensis TaxID=113560 RepID=A0A919SE36_9ACTN|nr:hypothetical protein Aco04nite_17840 [Actinoplanes consettensis]
MRDLLPWLVIFAAVGALSTLLAITAVQQIAWKRGPVIEVLPIPLAPFIPVPPSSATPTGTPTRAPAPPPRTSSPAPSRSPSPSPSRVPAPAQKPTVKPTVTGEYQLVDAYDDAYIGEVLVSNSGAEASDWTVVLTFAAGTGALRTSWVESAPQANLTVDGQTYTWRSGVPVEPGATVALRFHIAREGASTRPRTCAVNGTACAQ